MSNRSKAYWVSCVLTFFSVFTANATTIVLPTDAQLIEKSSLIVKGTVSHSVPVDRRGAIWTETTIAVEDVLKGEAGAEVTVREIGGTIGDRITVIFGAPEYREGEHVLAFLVRTPRGDYQTADLFVGKFSDEKLSNGTRVWHRDESAENTTLLDHDFRPIAQSHLERDSRSFENYVLDRVAGRGGDLNYGVSNVVDPAPSGGPFPMTSNFTLLSEPTIYRWGGFDLGQSAVWYNVGSQVGYTGGGVAELQTAMASWTGYTGARILYVYGGAKVMTPGGNGKANGVNEVDFNDPLNEIAGSFNPATGGVVGQGGFNGISGTGTWTSTFAADATHIKKSWPVYNIIEGNLVIQDGVSAAAGISSSKLAEIVAHEFGHTLGLGHSADNTALMYYSATGLGPALRTDDQLAARWLYPGASTTPVPTSTLLKGDANGDNTVTTADAFYLINYLFSGGPAPLGPCDVNADGAVTSADVFYLINYLFSGGPAPR